MEADDKSVNHQLKFLVHEYYRVHRAFLNLCKPDGIILIMIQIASLQYRHSSQVVILYKV